ncbi:MAG: molybdopterin molybdenumtransferase MoeA [Alphaproteobacteria bacterium]|nr:molybdopterin molybdenumtransferase MoeA [Alphaproteobacteria bacterium]
MALQPLMPVNEALARIERAFAPVPSEVVSIAEAAGRVLAEDVIARVTQPPAAVSAMDGYAVIAGDVAEGPATLTVVGEAPAGGAFSGTLAPGQAVRIFTGGPVPAGADTIVIQEDVDRDGARIRVRESGAAGRHIRQAGLDFNRGDTVLRAGLRLGPREIALAAAMNVPWLVVRRQPRIALLATGNEIVRPGDPVGPNQIVSSNALGLAALLRSRGAEILDLGIAPDRRGAVAAMADGAAGTDLLITLGGASVGDHDLVQAALGDRGLEVDFWRIAMRPGKPLFFGRIGATKLLGLPGNPVSSLVCGLLFANAAVHRLLGRSGPYLVEETAQLGRAMTANDGRQDYLRATLSVVAGAMVATPFDRQDSSMLSLLARANCLLVRPPKAAAAKEGDPVPVIRLDPLPHWL